MKANGWRHVVAKKWYKGPMCSKVKCHFSIEYIILHDECFSELICFGSSLLSSFSFRKPS